MILLLNMGKNKSKTGTNVCFTCTTEQQFHLCLGKETSLISGWKLSHIFTQGSCHSTAPLRDNSMFISHSMETGSSRGILAALNGCHLSHWAEMGTGRHHKHIKLLTEKSSAATTPPAVPQNPFSHHPPYSTKLPLTYMDSSTSMFWW